ncbi:MAG: purine-binding chemotaxis protein CheW [Pseudomonadales bacterium]|nr:purine-binding chemotaxis protein CheW [Pseudomonadales bacterium]
MSKVNAAYRTLHDYSSRCKETSTGLPKTEELKKYWSGIGFSLEGKNYVAPLNETAEILQIPAYTSVPGVKKWLRGVANVRGKLLPVLDLLSFLNSDKKANIKTRRLLVIEKNTLYSGVIVDKVYGMQHFDTDDYSEEISEENNKTAPYITGSYSRDGETWRVFSPYRLSEDPDFINVAS